MIPYLKGSILALMICLNVGPGLVLQFKTSINYGFKAGAGVVAGLYSVNLGILVLTYFGFARILKINENITLASIIGGLFLITYGGVMLFRQVTMPDKKEDDPVKNSKSHLPYMIKGAAVNVTNPFNIIFWFGMVSVAGSQYAARKEDFFAFFIGLFVSAVVVDLLKCYAFSHIGKFFSVSTLAKINHGLGLLLILLGIGLAVRGVFFH